MKFDQYAQEANEFVKELARELGNANDTDHADRVMRAVFHTLRDIITPDESLDLISQLPMYLKAVYVNGWKSLQPPKERIRSIEAFLQRVRDYSGRAAGRDFGNDDTATEKTKAVFRILKRHINVGEIQNIIDQFPMELAGLWLTEADEQV